MLVLLLATALATPPSTASEEPTVPLRVEPAATTPPPSADQLVQQARQRMQAHDYTGARIVAGDARRMPGDHLVEATYLYGMAWEFEGHPERAIPLYDELQARWPDSPRQQDTRYRRAESLGALGFYDSALGAIASFKPYRQHDRASMLKLALLDATWTLASGHPRRGDRHLRQALNACQNNEVSFYQAQGQFTRLHALSNELDGLDLQGPQKRQIKQLNAWASALGSADGLSEQIIRLQEPIWTLEALQLDGQLYERFGDRLLSARIGSTLSGEQYTLYWDGLRQKTEIIWVKALGRYQRGLDLATHLGLTGDRVARVEHAHATLRAKIDSL